MSLSTSRDSEGGKCARRASADSARTWQICCAFSIAPYPSIKPITHSISPCDVVARSRSKISRTPAIFLGRTSVEQIDHHQRALAFGDIAAALLAIASGRNRRGHRLIRVFDHEIEQIIADLKRDRNGLAKIALWPVSYPHRPPAIIAPITHGPRPLYHPVLRRNISINSRTSE